MQKRQKSKFWVVWEKRSQLYLQEHRMYGSYPLQHRVILTNSLCQAKQFSSVDDALRHMNSRIDYQNEAFDWMLIEMDAKETNEIVYPVWSR